MRRKRQSRAKYYARRVQLLIADPKKALKAKDVRSDPEVCQRFLEGVDDRQNRNPIEAKKLAAIGVRHAAGIDNACLRSQSFRVLASTHRALGDVTKTEKCLKIARSLCKCSTCTGDRLRRQAYLRIYQGRLEEALSDSHRALSTFQDKDGKGRARICQGEVYFHLGDLGKAIAVTFRALKEITLPDSALYHRCAVYNIGAFIIHSDNPSTEAVFFAARQLESAKKLFYGLQSDLSAERARFDWTFAILLWRLGQQGRRTYQLLTSARDRFVALAMTKESEMAQDAAAVTADLAWLSDFDRREIRRLLRSLTPLREYFKEEVLHALNALYNATRVKVGTSDEIRNAILRLREQATGPGIVPSVLTLMSGPTLDDASPIGF